jgi:hypothetical protein
MIRILCLETVFFSLAEQITVTHSLWGPTRAPLVLIYVTTTLHTSIAALMPRTYSKVPAYPTDIRQPMETVVMFQYNGFKDA